MLGICDMRGMVALLAALGCAAPASAATRLGWTEGTAGLPPGVEAAALDAAPGLGVLAGRDATGAALLAEDDGSGWTAIAGLPDGATLTDVAVDGLQAWAVGHDAGAPLALHRAAEGGWAPVPVPAGVPALRSVALAPGTQAGYVGGDGGAVHAIGSGEQGPFVQSAGLTAPGSGAVTGIALRAAADGFVVAAPSGLGTGGGMFRLVPGSPALQPMPVTRSSSGLPPVDVATSAATAVAISSTHLWRLTADGQSWTVETGLPTGASTPPATLGALDLGADGTEVIAGAWSGDGAIWRRAPGVGWLRDDELTPGAPLTAVAARAADDLQAAGAGAALRYGPIFEPDPEPSPTAEPTVDPGETPEPEPEETATPTPTAEPADSEDDDDGGAEPATVTEAGIPPSPPPASDPGTEPAAPPAVVVTTPAPKATPPAPKRVLSDVRVAPQRGRLLITFRLSARARVAFSAALGKRVVGRTRTKALRPGRWQVVMRYRGRRVPTRLSAVVKPVKKAK